MNCPNCGSAGIIRKIRKCSSCGEAFANEDLHELHQLEFLVKETASWSVAETKRSRYVSRLKVLRKRLQPRPPVELETEAVIDTIPTLGPAPKSEPVPTKEKLPFDQWLLSERNIKFALYAGGLLLLVAGLIFIGVNWTRISGPAKFAITVMITGMMYLGGYLLYQREEYRIGGITLLGVASGFLTLNFAVLQIYVLGPAGLRNDVMWMIASPLCLLLFMFTAYWTKSDLFTYLSLAAIASTMQAVMVVVNAHELVYLVAYSLLAYTILILVRLFQASRFADFTRQPLLIVSQVGMPLIILTAIISWRNYSSCTTCPSELSLLTLLALSVGVPFYISTDVIFKWPISRWASAILFPITLGLFMTELQLSDSVMGITFMVIALAYLGVGYYMERREGSRTGAWSLYGTAYGMAILVTLMAGTETDNLAKFLFGDVVLLAVSAAIYRDYRWVYGAVWLFMLPVYLVIGLYVPKLPNQGLLMGILGLNYTAVGYALGRRTLRQGGPFLTAAAFLSAVVATLTWGNPIVASFVIGLIALLYAAVAFWLGWHQLLIPSLVAINLVILAISDFLVARGALVQALVVSYTGLGIALALGGYRLRRANLKRWAWPLYLIGVIDLAGAYLAGFVIGGLMRIGLSIVLAILLLAFAWLERAEFAKSKLPPFLTYLGLAGIVIGYFFTLDMLGVDLERAWPPIIAGLCGLFVVLGLLLRSEQLSAIYATPLRYVGLVLLGLPIAGAVFLSPPSPVLAAVTFAIAGLIYSVDGAIRRVLYLAYLAVGSYVVVIWAVLLALNVSELQAYVLPPGLALLGGGWNERRRGGDASFRIPTQLGLALLMIPTFVQSLPQGAIVYAVLLGGESLATLAWGVRIRSRTYARLGVLAFLANAIVQLRAGFVDLPRWLQIGATGVILLGGGLIALFRREELLDTRQKLSERWREWES